MERLNDAQKAAFLDSEDDPLLGYSAEEVDAFNAMITDPFHHSVSRKEIRRRKQLMKETNNPFLSYSIWEYYPRWYDYMLGEEEITGVYEIEPEDEALNTYLYDDIDDFIDYDPVTDSFSIEDEYDDEKPRNYRKYKKSELNRKNKQSNEQGEYFEDEPQIRSKTKYFALISTKKALVGFGSLLRLLNNSTSYLISPFERYFHEKPSPTTLEQSISRLNDQSLLKKLSIITLTSLTTYLSFKSLSFLKSTLLRPSKYMGAKILYVVNGKSSATAFQLAKQLLLYSPHSISILCPSYFDISPEFQSLIDEHQSADVPMIRFYQTETSLNIEKDVLKEKIQQIIKAVKGIDILILNAGIENYSPIYYQPSSNYDVFSACSNICLPYLLKSNRSHIITNCSIDDVPPHMFKHLYPEFCSIKSFFEQFESKLRDLLSMNISVLLPAESVPLQTRTSYFSSHLFFDYFLKSLIGLRSRTLSPSSLANYILFLAAKQEREYGYSL